MPAPIPLPSQDYSYLPRAESFEDWFARFPAPKQQEMMEKSKGILRGDARDIAGRKLNYEDALEVAARDVREFLDEDDYYPQHPRAFDYVTDKSLRNPNILSRNPNWNNTSLAYDYTKSLHPDPTIYPGQLLYRINWAGDPVGRFSSKGSLLVGKSGFYPDSPTRYLTTLGGLVLGGSVRDPTGKLDFHGREGSGNSTTRRPHRIESQGSRVLVMTPNQPLTPMSLKSGKGDFQLHRDFRRASAGRDKLWKTASVEVDDPSKMRLLGDFDANQFGRLVLLPHMDAFEKPGIIDDAVQEALKSEHNLLGTPHSVLRHKPLPRANYLRMTPWGLLGALGLTGAAAQASTSDNPTIRNTGKAALTGLQIAELADPVSHMGRGGYAVGKFAGHQTGLHDALARTKPVQDLAVWGDTSKRSFLKNLNEQQERWEAAELDRAIEKVLAEEAAERQAAEKDRQYQAMRAEYMNAPGNALFFRER